MVSSNYRDEPNKTADPENYEEIIYHLDLEDEVVGLLEETFEVQREEMVCEDCGDRPVWFVSEIRTPAGFDHYHHGRLNHVWCDDCMPAYFRELWAWWPWTPDDEIGHVEKISEQEPNECFMCGENLDWTWLEDEDGEPLCLPCYGIDFRSV